MQRKEVNKLDYRKLFINYENKLCTSLNYKDMPMLMDYVYYCYYLSRIENNYTYYEKSKQAFQYIMKYINSFKLGLSSFNGLLGLAYLYRALYHKVNDTFIIKIEDYLKFQVKGIFYNYDWKSEGMLYKLYDIFTGISGIGRYFLLYERDEKFVLFCIKQLMEIVFYDDNLFGFKEILNKDSQKVESINWGLSHGLISVGVFLSDCIKKGYNDEKIKICVEKIILMYLNNYRYENGIINWPSVSIIKKDGIIPEWSWRMSWCYGNIGILRSLYLISNNIKNSELSKFVLEHLETIISSNLENMNLVCSTFCHGLSAPMVIMKFFSNEIGKEDMKAKTLLFSKDIERRILNNYNPKFKYGFCKYEKYNNEILEIYENTSILEGITSIYVSLILSNYEIEEDIFSKEAFIR